MQLIVLDTLRLLIGWISAGFLDESQWILAGFAEWIA